MSSITAVADAVKPDEASSSAGEPSPYSSQSSRIGAHSDSVSNPSSSQSSHQPRIGNQHQSLLTYARVNAQSGTGTFHSQPQQQSAPQSASSSNTSAVAAIDVSPTCAATSSILDPIKTPESPSPGSASTMPTQSPSVKSHQYESTVSTSTSSSSGRRGSLAMLRLPGSLVDPSRYRNRDKDGGSNNGSLPSTPVYEVPETQANMSALRPVTSLLGTGYGNGKGRETYEMTTVPGTKTAPAIALAGRQRVDVGTSPADVNKEDLAMAKWRKWTVEQPVHIAGAESSPIRSRRASPANSLRNGTSGQSAISPRVSNLSSPRMGTNISPRNAFGPLSALDTGLEPHRSNSAESSSSAQARGFSPLGNSSRLGSSDYEIFNTDSVLALRDVELAIDEELLAKVETAKHVAARRMSTQPRISDLPNPFVDIAQRLGSRRVRPIVIELIQALGHFVDAVWCHHYPNRPCPWIIGVDESPTPASIKRMTNALNLDSAEAKMVWKSPMITAVQEGKKTGHVGEPPTVKDMRFWSEEVTFAIRDVDEVVGIYKGVGWAFGSAMRDGEYGAVVQENVLGVQGEGGGMVRLLNDLEEAIWGDAPPRQTDLAYDLPIEFDPYAVPDDAELLAAASMPRGGAGGRSGLSDFFASTAVGSTGGAHTPLSINEEEAYVLPDLVEARAVDNDNDNDNDNDSLGGRSDDADGAQVVSPSLTQSPTVHVAGAGSGLRSPDGQGQAKTVKAHRQRGLIPGIDIEGTEDLSLEELGKKRHREWIESMRGGGSAW